MKIEQPAIDYINTALKNLNKDYCHIGVVSHCCHNKQIDMYLINKDEAVRLIDLGGITVDFTEEAEQFLEGFTLTMNGNGLSFIPPEGWNPHQGGCGHHEHKEGECCGHHEHEEGECCGQGGCCGSNCDCDK